MQNTKLITAVILTAVIALPLSAAAQSADIDLPAPRMTGGQPLMQALKNRKSTRSFAPTEIPMETLSDLLWAADGINRPDTGLRTAPSAHNAQEITIYVALKQGVYRYNPESQRLEHVLNQDIRSYTGHQKITQEAPVNLIYVADLKKVSSEKQFYSAADTAFISQNVYLFCASEGLATVVLGWVDKDALGQRLGLKDEQKVILCQPVGFPK